MTTSGFPTAHSAAPRPRGRVATAAEWVTATGNGRVHTLTDPTPVCRPRWSSDVSGPSIRQVEKFVAPAAQVVEVPGACAWGPDGTVVTADGCVVESTTRAWGRALEAHPIWSAAPSNGHQVHGAAAAVAARGAATNFGHFLADTVPSIQLVHDTGIDIDTWIVSSMDHSWQRDGLRIAGVSADNVIALTDLNWVSADTLVVPSRTGFAPTTAPWARDALIRLIHCEPRSRHRRILISRSRSWRRCLLNADELHDVLAPHGFEHVDFDSMALTQQIETIHETQVIVAVHGSALGHLLHAPASGKVVEIANPRNIHPEFWGLAALAGWNHTLIDATPKATRPGEDDLSSDLHVDAQIVRAAAVAAAAE